MTLEGLEEKAVGFLTQVSNPLVSITRLLQFLQRDEQFAQLSEPELNGFLRSHESFRIIERPPDTPAEKGSRTAHADATDAGPWVILSTRVPSREQLSSRMREQAEKMTGALGAALQIARDSGDSENARELIRLMERAQRLQQMLKDALEEKSE